MSHPLIPPMSPNEAAILAAAAHCCASMRVGGRRAPCEVCRRELGPALTAAFPVLLEQWLSDEVGLPRSSAADRLVDLVAAGEPQPERKLTRALLARRLLALAIREHLSALLEDNEAAAYGAPTEALPAAGSTRCVP